MSEEIFNSTILEIKNIFQFLTEQEPTPDDEIEAREKLINLFNNLKQNNTHPENSDLIKQIINDLEEWDTLELWFKEVESLIVGIRKILEFSLKEKEPDVIKSDMVFSNSSSEPEKSNRDTSAELLEIVAQVSEQFKGQIESLKEKIESLQEELDKKTEQLDEIKEIQEDTEQDDTIYDYKEESIEEFQESSTPSEFSKLQPPKIHIPHLKVQPPKPETDETGLELSDMENALKELSNMGNTLQEISDKEDHPKESKILPDVVEEEVIFTEIPKMPKDGLNEIPKSPIEVTESIEEELELTEIPKRDSAELSEIPKSTKEDKAVSKEDLKLTEIPGISPPDLKDKQKKRLITPKIIEEDASLTEIPKITPSEIENEQERPMNTEFITIAQNKDSNVPEKPKKKSIIPDVIEEVAPAKSNSLESSLFIPGDSKKKDKNLQNLSSLEDSSKEQKDAIFMLKKPSVKLEEIETESIKTTRKDLFDVFSSIPEQGLEADEKMEIDDTKITSKKDSGDKSKKKKKKESAEEKTKKKDKKKSKSKKEEPLELSENSVNHIDSVPQVATVIDYDNLPNDKDLLYQNLIAFEGKRYSIEKDFKELKEKFTNRKIDENEFRKQSSKLNSSLKKISSNITKIRNAIAKL